MGGVCRSRWKEDTNGRNAMVCLNGVFVLCKPSLCLLFHLKGHSKGLVLDEQAGEGLG